MLVKQMLSSRHRRFAPVLEMIANLFAKFIVPIKNHIRTAYFFFFNIDNPAVVDV